VKTVVGELCCFCCDIQPEDASGQLDYRYDEFGFKVEEEGLTCFFCVESGHFLAIIVYVVLQHNVA